uniref:(northern house mosquito) hypothetical protein n=1 Tax=Culex pipiens TaxID=7175 RepID=A0A8D8DAI4_CULPI
MPCSSSTSEVVFRRRRYSTKAAIVSTAQSARAPKMEYPRAPPEVSDADAIWVEFSGLAEGGRVGMVVELVWGGVDGGWVAWVGLVILGGVGGWVAGAGLVGVVGEADASVVGMNVTMSLPVVMTVSVGLVVGSVDS